MVEITRRGCHGRSSDRRDRAFPRVKGESVPSTFGVRVRRAGDVRALRMRVFLLVTVLLLPLVLITVFADR